MTDAYGDPVLARRLQRCLKQPHPVAAVAGVAAAGSVVASLGADLHADHEIGSISKDITGLLYAEALDRGEVHRTTTLGESHPLGAVPPRTSPLNP